MNHVTRRMGRGPACLALFCILLSLLSGGAAALSGGEEAAIRAAALSYLQRYQETSLLYEERDLLSDTVADPFLHLPEGTERAVFRFGKKEYTLARLRENISYLEQKAACQAGMRQMQEICREDLHLTYALEELEAWDNACRVSVRSTASFRYTDSSLPSVYETGFSVYLVRLGHRWLVADAADGSQFDETYKDAGPLDAAAVLEAFAGQLARERCTVTSAGQDGGGIPYRGRDAAAYACTYSRRQAGEERADFYNPRFFSYAEEGGDCQNFASQCMWAGFGGSEDGVKRRAMPMDTAGSGQWFGRAASGGALNRSWLSCQSFRRYLTGSRDGTGRGGSNAAGEAGMCATVLDVGAGSPLSAVTAEELVGAVAHVDGSGGPYSHAIVLTAASGTARSQIWYCGHTRDVTHVKLGDVYTGPIRVFIPRYMRTGASGGAELRAERLQPVAAGESALLTARADAVLAQMSVTVTAPDGTAEQAAVLEDTDVCQTAYCFSVPGLYRVAYAGSGAAPVVHYVRCYAPSVPAAPEDAPVPDGPPAEEPEPPAEEPVDGEMPDWLLNH